MTIWFCSIILYLFKVCNWDRWQHMWTKVCFAWKKPQYNFALVFQLQSIQKLSLTGRSQTDSVMHFSCSGDAFSGVLQVSVPQASHEDKELCQSFGQLIFKICYSLAFCASTRFQKSLISAKQLCFLSTQRDPPVPIASTQAPFRKAIYCIWDVWLALCSRNGSRPPGRKYSGGNKNSSVLLEGGCTCSLPEYVTPSAAFYPEMLPLLNSQF